MDLVNGLDTKIQLCESPAKPAISAGATRGAFVLLDAIFGPRIRNAPRRTAATFLRRSL